MLALQREAAWAEERLLGDLWQSVPQKRPRPFARYRYALRDTPWTYAIFRKLEKAVAV